MTTGAHDFGQDVAFLRSIMHFPMDVVKLSVSLEQAFMTAATVIIFWPNTEPERREIAIKAAMINLTKEIIFLIIFIIQTADVGRGI